MLSFYLCIFFFKQTTAYEVRIRDWSSDVCASDLTSCSSSISHATGPQVSERGRADATRRAGSAFPQRRQQPGSGPDRLQFAAAERVVAGGFSFVQPWRVHARPRQVGVPLAIGHLLVAPIAEIDRTAGRPEFIFEIGRAQV